MHFYIFGSMLNISNWNMHNIKSQICFLTHVHKQYNKNSDGKYNAKKPIDRQLHLVHGTITEN